MHRLPRIPRCLTRIVRRSVAAAAAVITLSGLIVPSASALELRDDSQSTIAMFRTQLAKTVRADHPAILPVVNAIRAVSNDPLEQLVMVNDVTHLLVDFDHDWRVYGRTDYHATLDEMIEMRRLNGWLYLRDDCDGRAVFAAHLLASLGIKWRFEASRIKAHAWVVATVNGKDYDLLDFQPEGAPVDSAAYRMWSWTLRNPVHPPRFEWRRAWGQRTQFDVAVGIRLGLLSVDSVAGNLRERRSTDWAKIAPDSRTTPADERLLAASVAGFPFGESLLPANAIAGTPPATTPAQRSVTPSPTMVIGSQTAENQPAPPSP